jgi:hypothetical protein
LDRRRLGIYTTTTRSRLEHLHKLIDTPSPPTHLIDDHNTSPPIRLCNQATHSRCSGTWSRHRSPIDTTRRSPCRNQQQSQSPRALLLVVPSCCTSPPSLSSPGHCTLPVQRRTRSIWKFVVLNVSRKPEHFLHLIVSSSSLFYPSSIPPSARSPAHPSQPAICIQAPLVPYEIHISPGTQPSASPQQTQTD